MSFFDFMKNAGEKIFKPGEAKAEEARARHIGSYGLDIAGLKIEVDGSTAVIEGQAKDAATREKAVLVAGNIEGISRVDDRLTVRDNGPDFSGVTTGSSTVAAGEQASGGQGSGGQASSGQASEWTSRTYTVEKGDTLSRIAKEMYGDAGKYPVIFEANKPMLKDPDKIYPGQVLRIPAEA